ncbi:hypothetical protein HPB52_007415 [Rhipicephalus sanguineus]|uniref:EF-hand domain-containing protein n=1 Tax=Rhipicephalus sanguineus TaxID=34632 RepID=A0A9D4PMX2_RHISA|nr:hypothetical protein HPB52_007415 [Rhipicephalus sanguineus]
MLGERWLTAWVLLAAALWPRYAAIPEEDDARSDQEGPTFEEIEDLRTRYSAVQISRDSEMHDYDDNNQLDGLELMQAFDHLLEHNNETSTEAKLVAMVDNLMAVDANNDGLVSFPEWLAFIRTTNPKEHENIEHGGNVGSQGQTKHSHLDQ